MKTLKRSVIKLLQAQVDRPNHPIKHINAEDISMGEAIGAFAQQDPKVGYFATNEGKDEPIGVFRSVTTDFLICVECKGIMPHEMHNYGTPELPCCIHCMADANKEEIEKL